MLIFPDTKSKIGEKKWLEMNAELSIEPKILGKSILVGGGTYYVMRLGLEVKNT